MEPLTGSAQLDLEIDLKTVAENTERPYGNGVTLHIGRVGFPIDGDIYD